MTDETPTDPDYVDHPTPFGRVNRIHLPSARVVCYLYRWARQSGLRDGMARICAYVGYMVMHRQADNEEAKNEVHRIIGFGFDKHDWYMRGLKKPAEEQIEMLWACAPPKQKRNG